MTDNNKMIDTAVALGCASLTGLALMQLVTVTASQIGLRKTAAVFGVATMAALAVNDLMKPERPNTTVDQQKPAGPTKG